MGALVRIGLIAAVAVALGLPATGLRAHPGIPPSIVARIPARVLPLPQLRNPTLVEQGRRLFENETFGGNGRTCATCHPRSNNFTIDVPFIRSRPPSDPLFVFERVPALAGLENGPALRGKGLILENLDGFDQPGVLRSVPHIFALGLTTKPEAGRDQVHSLGWGGDGSPGDGSIRSFAVGAVIQHFPKTLERVEDRDFRLPTGQELDALEAFQRSIGRRETPNTEPTVPGHLVFEDLNVTAGQTLFAGMPSRQVTRRCSGCHGGGGALNDVDAVGENEQRANGNDRHPGVPACQFDGVPVDGGFGLTPVDVIDRATLCTNGKTGEVTSQGNRFFSVPSAIEAADTKPFFHNNSADTMEEVVDFYRSSTFDQSPTGAGNGFLINDDQRNQIALFVRMLNVLENIRSAKAALTSLADARLLARLVVIDSARRDVADAIQVIQEGNIKAYQNTALPALRQAWTNLVVLRADRALANLEVARGLIAN